MAEQGLTLEQALQQGYKPAAAQIPSRGLTLEEAQAQGFQPIEQQHLSPKGVTPPPSFAQRFADTPQMQLMEGAGQTVGNAGLGALQWMQDLPRQVREAITGKPESSTVTPTPTWLQPNTTLQKIGAAGGDVALQGGLAAATGGTSLPVQVGAQGLMAGLMAGTQGAGPTGTQVAAGLGAAGPIIAKLLPALINQLPSTARAGASFDKIMAGAKNLPIDTTQADQAIARAQELASRGFNAPKIVSSFADAPRPMTYEAGRDFASKAGQLTASEKLSTEPQMQRQVALFAQSMKDANRAPAASIGMGDLYDAAMKEYHAAKTLAEKTATIAKWTAAAAATAAGVGGAYRLFSSLQK